MKNKHQLARGEQALVTSAHFSHFSGLSGLRSYQLNFVQKTQDIFSLFFFASFAPLRETFLVLVYPG